MAVPKKGRSKSLVKLNKINDIKSEFIRLNKIILNKKLYKINNKIIL